MKRGFSSDPRGSGETHLKLAQTDVGHEAKRPSSEAGAEGFCLGEDKSHAAPGDRLIHECVPTGDVPARIWPALLVLLEAWQYAEQTNGNYWEFAVELSQLSALGLARNDFRWLVR